ncbi:MAG TPA: hypothetical protein VEB00_13980 [Clostridia bacterium]|nr:hypothetical protein [Clostridia bacterium]
MKKTLALVLALAMVFSTITVAFAEGTIGADAQICSDLGMLKGSTGTVDAAYTATAPTRIQAAVMVLRLRGLEADALAFPGEANFTDGNIAWAEGSNLLAYLKANPQLGWGGNPDGSFNPSGLMTAQAYYKVMLEALGYKQNTAEVVGDFAYADVVTFAASKGLTKVAAVTNFTVNDLATATVETLNANMKDGGKTLVATLVEAGKVDKAKAVAAGLYTDVLTTTAAKLDSVSTLGNSSVLVEFDGDVEKAFAENVANYKVVEKGTTTAVEVKAAVLDGTELVVLETPALTAGKAYTLTVAGASKNFAGIAKDSSAPEIDDVDSADTERVVVTFTTSMDLATALDKANYAIEGVTIESIAWDDADGARDAVELTTKGLVASKTYKVAVTNVKSIDAVTMKSDSMNFVAKSDKKAPRLDTDNDNTFVDTNTRIVVTFTDDNELTKESAENLANYKLEIGNTTNTLEITAAKLVEFDDNDLRVELTTVPQKNNQKYELHVSNIVDTSVLANKMAKEETINLYGEDVDEDAPELVGMEYLSKNLVDVEFDDDSRLDTTSILDINNYEFDNDVVVEKAELADADDADNMVVRLTVSDLGEESRYEITVENIADEYGNVMDKPEDDQETYDKEDVARVAGLLRAEATSDTEIVLHFQYKDLVEATAEDVANYEIDGDIGTPSKASYDDEDNTVTLTTEEMDANAEYEITINGVTDIAGNEIVDLTADVVVASTENDTEAPEIDEIESDFSTIVVVTFNEAMEVDPAAYTAVGGLEIEIDINGATVGGNVFGTYAVSGDEDDTVLEFTVPAFLDDKDVELVSTTAVDLAGNAADVDEDGIEFSASDEPVDAIELDTWDQTDVFTFELQYSAKVRLINSLLDQVSDGGYDFTIEVDDDDKTLVTLTSDDELEVDDEIYLILDNMLVGFHGEPVADTDKNEAGTANSATYLEVELEDEDEPFIESVKATDRTTVDITFSEDLEDAGSWIIAYEDEDGDMQDMTIGTPELDDNVVTLTLTNEIFESDMVYTLIVTDLPKDLTGNEMDAETGEDENDDGVYDFAGTDVVGTDAYITGVKVVNGTKFKVYTSADVTVATQDVYLTSFATAETDETDEFLFVAGTVTVATYDDIPTSVLAVDNDYKVTINGMEYEFEGVVENDIDVDYDDGANVAVEGDELFEFDFDDMEENDLVVVLGNTNAAAEVDANEEAVIDAATISGEVEILVMRGNVVLFYLPNFDLEDLR